MEFETVVMYGPYNSWKVKEPWYGHFNMGSLEEF